MTTIHDILKEFREAATSNRDMGDKFERLIAVCSDTAVGKQAGDMEDIRLHDLPFSATTDARKLATQLNP